MNLIEVKTADLTGAALDWAVAASMPCAKGMMDQIVKRPMSYIWRFSTDWSQGGPIIEREIHNLFKWNQLDPAAPEMWCGVHNRQDDSGIYAVNVDGPTPLIAAMRCYVASKKGDTVMVPAELVEGKE